MIDGVRIEAFQRIQCTVDLLPQDILGFNRYEMQNNTTVFHSGPVFANFLLCDEINLLTPKTQGSFLQVMEEQKMCIRDSAVVIQHGDGLKTLYAHMSGLRVRSGQEVAGGQEIGISGTTGLSTGPHLHFEVIQGGRPVNPWRFVRF